jgi:hypothetical protein
MANTLLKTTKGQFLFQLDFSAWGLFSWRSLDFFRLQGVVTLTTHARAEIRYFILNFLELKGQSSDIFIPFFEPIWIGLGLNMSRLWF